MPCSDMERSMLRLLKKLYLNLEVDLKTFWTVMWPAIALNYLTNEDNDKKGNTEILT